MKKKRQFTSEDLRRISLMRGLKTLKDTERLQKTARTLKAAEKMATGGREVSSKRLEAAQEFLLELLEEIDSKRPASPPSCSGGRGDRKRHLVANL